jgi:hypothetical protein
MLMALAAEGSRLETLLVLQRPVHQAPMLGWAEEVLDDGPPRLLDGGFSRWSLTFEAGHRRPGLDLEDDRRTGQDRHQLGRVERASASALLHRELDES